jgi:hypothetical protein
VCNELATTHWTYWRLLEKLGARHIPEQRWVEDGKFLCSAGIDMALYLGASSPTNNSPTRRSSSSKRPRPAFGGIHWAKVDRQMMVPHAHPTRPRRLGRPTGPGGPADRLEGV